ncbi:contact-dependent growth inhibition system immunity protein [Chromobacterium subtsugae]|uniref:contact-dependent growth inhibition system immunity protein n=1 Tax=Chromobacterium subtsugae TaxID=251747 RepID=UPI0006415F0F
MTIESLEALGQLLGCYFHQDWTDEFDDDMSALRAIVESEPREKVKEGIGEIDELLKSPTSESELRGILTGEVGCYYDPSAEGMTYQQWLRRVREVFAMA